MDIAVTLVLVCLGLYLLVSPTRTPPTILCKQQNPLGLLLVGTFLIVLTLHSSASHMLVCFTQARTSATVLASVPGKTLRSGKTRYQLSYEYPDSAGVTRRGSDIVYSVTPLNTGGHIDIVYSFAKPSASQIASNVNFFWAWGLGLGLLYEFWAIRGFVRQRRLKSVLAGTPKLEPLKEVVVTAGMAGPMLGLLLALFGSWELYNVFSRHLPGDIKWEVVAVAGTLFVAGLYLVLLSLSIRLTISDRGILSQRLFRPPTRDRLTEVSSVLWGKHGNKGKGFLINTTSGQPLHVPAYYQNLEGLVSGITLHLRPDMYASAQDGFAHARRMAGLAKGIRSKP